MSLPDEAYLKDDEKCESTRERIDRIFGTPSTRRAAMIEARAKQTRKSLGWWALNVFAWAFVLFYAWWAYADEATIHISAALRDAATVAVSTTAIIAPDAVQVNGRLILVL